MAASSKTAQSLRVSPAALKGRLEAGEPVTILDTRGAQAWQSSAVKLRGAVRADAQDLHVDPGWPKDRLTVAYCT
jgi:hypothetical protein